MKKVLALGAATVCALGVMGGAFAAEEPTIIEALYNVDESYTVTFPAGIEFDDYNNDQTATVEADEVLLNDGNKLKITMVSTNGALKNGTSSIAYTLANGENEPENIVANTPFDILTVESGNRYDNIATLTFTSGDDTNVTLAGKHSDTLTFNVIIDSGIAFMQNIDARMKADIASGTITQLKDSRDNKVYTVAKIGSDIWMTKNLNYLDNDDNTTWDDGIFYSEEYDETYYTWVAATASDGNTNSDADSICPKGWTLPTGNGENSQFGALASVYNKDTILSEPFYGTLSGVAGSYEDGGDVFAAGFGETTVYWSSDKENDGNYYGLLITSDDMALSYYEEVGGSVRCVAK